MELKAPAGNLASARVALEAGADNVYVGLAETNHQRKQLKNLTRAELAELAQGAGRTGKKVTVALNSTVTEDALPRTLRTIEDLAVIGVSGVILSDHGLAHEVARTVPGMKVIFSVQGECSNVRHARMLREIGVHRLVLDRNMSIREAKRIRDEVGLEVELFVFGFSCNSQDALCFMGDYWSGSPCNVHCTQKVRFLDVPGFEAPKRYLFMQYYSGLRYLPQLREAGVDGLKIEGRQRSSEFVRRTVSAFRHAIDHLEACRAAGRPFHLDAAWVEDLRAAAMAFEVTDGFFQTNAYHRTVLDEPGLATMAHYAVDTARNLAEGQTSLAFLKRSLVGHVRRAVSRPEHEGPRSGRTVPGF
jgi:putative protease